MWTHYTICCAALKNCRSPFGDVLLVCFSRQNIKVCHTACITLQALWHKGFVVSVWHDCVTFLKIEILANPYVARVCEAPEGAYGVWLF